MRFGVEPYEDPEKLKPAYEVLAKALSTKLGCEVELQVVDDYAAEVLAMRNDKLEIAQFGPLGYVFASQKAGAEPMVSFADGSGKLTSYTAGIWVAKDSPVQKIEDLPGKSLALSSVGSASGDALPRYGLKKHDVGDVKLDYAGGHPEAMLSLINGRRPEFSPAALISGLDGMADFLAESLPPDLSVLGKSLEAAVITLYIGLLGTTFSIPFALALALLASRATTSAVWAQQAARAVLSFLRSVPDVVFALIFVTAVGLGPFAGVLALVFHNTGVMGKLWAEAMDESDRGPRDALQRDRRVRSRRSRCTPCSRP